MRKCICISVLLIFLAGLFTGANGQNIIGEWAGPSNAGSGNPTDYGWDAVDATIPWNTANGDGGVRYIDVNTSSNPVHILNGSNYQGRLLTLRWDGPTTAVYLYPVTLEANSTYDFSFIYEHWNNGETGVPLQVGISKTKSSSGIYSSSSYTTVDKNTLLNGTFKFRSQEAGTYYLTFAGGWAMFGIGELQLAKSDDQNLTAGWAGPGGVGTGFPTEYGWSSLTTTVPWNTANSGGGVRYMDVTASSNPVHIWNGAPYEGRLLLIRWDSNSYSSATYTYAVYLEENMLYDFSFLYEYWGNISGDKRLTVGISKSENPVDIFSSQDLPQADAQQLLEGNFIFMSEEAGTYYLTFNGAWAIYAIGELILKKYEDNGIVTNQIITDREYNTGLFINKNVTVPGKSDVHITGQTPFVNSTVNLQHEDSWLFFDNIQPSKVKNNYLEYIRINGAPFEEGINGRVAIYAHGTVVMPHGADFMPLTVFTAENFSGSSKQYNLFEYHNNLGDFDNTILSFKLKRGYMATLANSPDGSGYSRVFIADNEDLEFGIMPDYLKGTISFIRIFKYEWVSKKGWGGSQTDANYVNATWNYDWGADGNTSSNVEYVPHKWGPYWPGWELNNKQNVTHVLGYNEPDRPDQADIGYEATINAMPAFYNSGFRVLSPATADPFNSWGTFDFAMECDERSYRLDAVALHCYWHKTASQWNSDLSYIHSRTGRPLWITEWNNGANWTDNSFLDNASYLTDRNAEKNLNDIIAILQVLDNSPYVERYAIYNWVQDARALILTINDSWKANNPDYENYQWLKKAPVLWEPADGSYKIVLTPAGEYYAKNKAPIAFNRNYEVIPAWNIPDFTLTHSRTEDNQRINLVWSGKQDELVGSYTIERKKENESGFTDVLTIDSYLTMSAETELFHNAEYRVRINAKYGSGFKYTNTVVGEKDLDDPLLLDTKYELDELLLSGQQISATGKEIISITPFDPARKYSLEVKAQIHSAAGRGMDIEARAQSGRGFRVSLDPTSITWSSAIQDITPVATVDNTREQTYRFAISGEKVHIFCGEEYLASRPLEYFMEIQADDTETEPDFVYGPVNYVSDWAGNNGSGAPTQYGWSCTPELDIWNVANGGSGVRYLDVTEDHTLNGTTYQGRLMTIRWDNGVSAYFYPVTLEENTTYDLSFIYEHWNNGQDYPVITTGISQKAEVQGIYNSAGFITGDRQVLLDGTFRFTTKEAGLYYLTFTGTGGCMFGIGEMELKKCTFENHLLIGKNYNGGNLDANVVYVSYDGNDAFAPEMPPVDFYKEPYSTKSVNEENTITVYAKANQLIVESEELISSISIVDAMSGRLILENKCEAPVFTTRLLSGIYIVKIITDEKVVTKPVIIK